MILSSFWDFNLPTDIQVWTIFSWQHLMMLSICIGITVSIYVFPKQYAYLSKTNYFLYSLVVVQIFFLVFLKTVEIISIPKYQVNNQNWTSVFPLDFCAITQILSIITVLWKNNKFFSASILFPIFGSWLTIIMPTSKQALTNNIDQLRFYEFFLAHYLSFFLFFFLYLFGKRKYEPKMWKVSILSLLFISLFDYILNASFGTDFMFMGPNASVGTVDFRNFVSVQLGNFLNTMFVINVVGFGGFWGVYFLLNYLVKPLYSNNGEVKLHDTWILALMNKVIIKFWQSTKEKHLKELKI